MWRGSLNTRVLAVDFSQRRRWDKTPCQCLSVRVATDHCILLGLGLVVQILCEGTASTPGYWWIDWLIDWSSLFSSFLTMYSNNSKDNHKNTCMSKTNTAQWSIGLMYYTKTSTVKTGSSNLVWWCSLDPSLLVLGILQRRIRGKIQCQHFSVEAANSHNTWEIGFDPNYNTIFPPTPFKTREKCASKWQKFYSFLNSSLLFCFRCSHGRNTNPKKI